MRNLNSNFGRMKNSHEGNFNSNEPCIGSLAMKLGFSSHQSARSAQHSRKFGSSHSGAQDAKVTSDWKRLACRKLLTETFIRR